VSEPLSSQLSRTLLAFTIEADDEFEHRVPHRTTDHGTVAGPTGEEETPWLVSFLMWSTCMRFVPDDGVSVRSYARSAWWSTPKGISTTLRRMGGWWGYLHLEDAAAPGSTAKADRIVRPSAGGNRAREVWAGLGDEIEGRWCDRFGRAQVGALRSALEELVDRFDRPLPDCLRLYDVDLLRRAPGRPEIADSLPGLLSQLILCFELEFESANPVPPAVCGNVLRVLSTDHAPVKDLAGRTGLAKEGAEGGLRLLERRGLAEVGSDPDGGRLRMARLTRAGAARRQEATELTDSIEERWRRRHGPDRIAALLDALAPITGEPDDPEGPLWAGLYRHADGWRSSLPRPETLPRHPVVSHRGGYLDGA
jgi:DNA-binding MarR family transcriptional regulator